MWEVDREGGRERDGKRGREGWVREEGRERDGERGRGQ